MFCSVRVRLIIFEFINVLLIASTIMTTMASVGISSRGGQLGGGGGGGGGDDASTFYYCFECDSTLTIAATSDSGVVCPNCDSAVLEEFETPSSSPPPPPPPPSGSTTLIDLQSFFPTSDTDSDAELSDALPPPPPPPPPPFFHDEPTILSRSRNLGNLHIHSSPQPPRPRPRPPQPLRSSSDFLDTLDSEFRHPLPPPPPLPRPPLVSVIDRLPQFHVPSAPTIDYFLFWSPEENELDFSPPPPPPPPLVSPSSSRYHWDYFFPPPTELDEDIQPLTSSIRSPPPPPPPRPQPPPSSQLSSRDNFNQTRALELQPPPPPPWLLPLPTEGLLDMKMTERLVSEWECHQCAICIDNFEVNQMVKLMPCKHLYHSVCILPWLDLHKSCPVCRSKIPSQ